MENTIKTFFPLTVCIIYFNPLLPSGLKGIAELISLVLYQNHMLQALILTVHDVKSKTLEKSFITAPGALLLSTLSSHFSIMLTRQYCALNPLRNPH